VNNPLDTKENYEHALDFALLLPRLFRSKLVWTFRVRLTLSFPNASLVIPKVSVALFPRLARNVMLFLRRIHREIASGQTYDSKYKDAKSQQIYPAAWNVVH
jgi:hypothetical protein